MNSYKKNTGVENIRRKWRAVPVAENGVKCGGKMNKKWNTWRGDAGEKGDFWGKIEKEQLSKRRGDIIPLSHVNVPLQALCGLVHASKAVRQSASHIPMALSKDEVCDLVIFGIYGKSIIRYSFIDMHYIELRW